MMLMRTHHSDACHKTNTLRGVVFFTAYISKHHSILTYTVHPALQGCTRSESLPGTMTITTDTHDTRQSFKILNITLIAYIHNN